MSLERRRAIADEVRRMNAEWLLHEFRRLEGIALTELADALGATYSTAAEPESEGGMSIRTLRRIVTALGGICESASKFPGKANSR